MTGGLENLRPIQNMPGIEMPPSIVGPIGGYNPVVSGPSVQRIGVEPAIQGGEQYIGTPARIESGSNPIDKPVTHVGLPLHESGAADGIEPVVAKHGEADEVPPGIPENIDGAASVAPVSRGRRLAQVFERVIPGLQSTQAGVELPAPGVEEVEIVQALGQKHFVQEAPRLETVVADETRTNTFAYWNTQTPVRRYELDGTTPPNATLKETSEHAGLVQLDSFLSTAAVELATGGTEEMQELALEAQGIRDSLHFIGDRELDQAAAGIAALWKSYLRDDPKHRLCVPHAVIRTDYPTLKKSTEAVFDRVMEHFSDEERAAYRGRILTNVNRVRRRPQDTKIVLLDDWYKSGAQLGAGLGRVWVAARGARNVSDRVEVHLVAASDEQLAFPDINGRKLPTYAYFAAGSDTGGSILGGPLVSGTHSSVDFGFALPIQKMVSAMNELHPDNPVFMPPLTTIARKYRNELVV